MDCEITRLQQRICIVLAFLVGIINWMIGCSSQYAVAHGTYTEVQLTEQTKIAQTMNLRASAWLDNEYLGWTCQGTHGRFYIDDLGIDVALYDAAGGPLAQKAVDEPDSAAFMPWGEQAGCIVDHATDGRFCMTRFAVPGETMACIVCDGTVSVYVCKEVHVSSTRLSKTVLDSLGRNSKEENKNGLTTYTCNYGGPNSVTLVYWEYCGEGVPVSC